MSPQEKTGPVTTLAFEEKGGKTLLVLHELLDSLW